MNIEIMGMDFSEITAIDISVTLVPIYYNLISCLNICTIIFLSKTLYIIDT